VKALLFGAATLVFSTYLDSGGVAVMLWTFVVTLSLFN